MPVHSVLSFGGTGVKPKNAQTISSFTDQLAEKVPGITSAELCVLL